MDRRYYLAKLALASVAIALAIVGGSMESGISHAFAHHPSYAAPAQLQAAAWHLTSATGHRLACLLSHTFKGALQPGL